MAVPGENAVRYNNLVPNNDFCTVSVKTFFSSLNPPFSPVHTFPLPLEPKCCQPFSRRTPRHTRGPQYVVGGRIPCGGGYVGQDDCEETIVVPRDTSFRLLTPAGRRPPPPPAGRVHRGLTVSSSRALRQLVFTRRAHTNNERCVYLEQHPFLCLTLCFSKPG